MQLKHTGLRKIIKNEYILVINFLLNKFFPLYFLNLIFMYCYSGITI